MKTKLPRDIQQQCLWIVRGYDRCRQEYKERRDDILNAGGEHYTTYKVKGEERRAYLPSSHNASRSTEDRELQLEGLESTLAYRQMKAVEHARDRIGAGLPEMLADYLRAAILQNCMDGRKYPFERLFTVGISRMGFYRCREAFLYDIANELGLL
jgi:hypothetical protein